MMRGMVIDMDDEQLRTLGDLQGFLDGTVAMDFTVVADERYEFIARTVHSRSVTIVIGVSKKWASCHLSKPVRLMPCERPPELQNRVQTIRAGTGVGHQMNAPKCHFANIITFQNPHR